MLIEQTTGKRTLNRAEVYQRNKALRRKGLRIKPTVIDRTNTVQSLIMTGESIFPDDPTPTPKEFEEQVKIVTAFHVTMLAHEGHFIADVMLAIHELDAILMIEFVESHKLEKRKS